MNGVTYYESVSTLIVALFRGLSALHSSARSTERRPPIVCGRRPLLLHVLCASFLRPPSIGAPAELRRGSRSTRDGCVAQRGTLRRSQLCVLPVLFFVHFLLQASVRKSDMHVRQTQYVSMHSRRCSMYAYRTTKVMYPRFFIYFFFILTQAHVQSEDPCEPPARQNARSREQSTASHPRELIVFSMT